MYDQKKGGKGLKRRQAYHKNKRMKKEEDKG